MTQSAQASDRPLPRLSDAVILTVVAVLAIGSLAAGGRPPNHLLGQSSPYLLEHLDNPVDWYPWGEEAIGRARREQKPIFLSIGYSACHWCHVMAREAFSDPEIARILNDRFVPIKVDREERPDLDALYLDAVVAMTGSGGWPLSVFLTPDLKPFYGGTYFPKDRFRDRLLAIASAWESHRQEALAAADSVHALLERRQRAASGAEPAAARRTAGAGDASWGDPSAEAVKDLEATFDHENGGFGSRPKFPPHGALWLLLETGGGKGDARSLDMVVRTLDAMARGGLYDQIGGGFHRYATDDRWLVPHFEKMLYDNALLVPLYLEAWRRTGRSDFRRVAEETIAWVEREMADPRGTFCASLDADSEGEEGRFYLWTPDEARAVLAPGDADLALSYYGLLDHPRFEGGRVLPHVAVPLAEFATKRGLDPAIARDRLEEARRLLFEARAKRLPPHRDGTILTAWNGLMISALARAARVTGDGRHLEAATRAARAILESAVDADGRPSVSWTGGRVGPPGTLDDSAFLARGLLDLYDAGSDRRFLAQAGRIARDAARFFDAKEGGYFLTAAGRQDLIVRTKSFEDQALPSGNAAMVECLGRLSKELHDPSLLDPARRTLELAGPVIRGAPLASPYLILAARFVTGPGIGGKRGTPSPSAEHASLVASSALAAEPERAPRASEAAAAGAGETLIHGTIVGRPSPRRVVGSSITLTSGPVRPVQAVTISLRLVIESGWHINSSRPTLSYLIPTKIEFTNPAAATVEEIAYPDGERVALEFAKETLSVYQGTTTIRATLSPTRDGVPGRRDVPARLTYQACSNKTCLAPEMVEFHIPLVVQGDPVARTPRTGGATAAAGVPDGAPSAGGAAGGRAIPGGGLAALLGSGGRGGEGVKALLAERGLLVLLGVVFLAGLALNLTPCVYPMMPVTIGFFVNQSSGSWGRRVALPALYVLGMAVTYSVLGVLAGLTGSLFGSWLQSPWVTGLLVLIFIVMALSMFGLFEIRMPGWLTRFSGGRQGGIGAFLMGLTMGVAAAPCIGPFIVPLLAFVGAAGKPVLGFWLFFVMAIGMGLPNLFLGIFSGAIGGLPRSGTWLIYAKKVMGVALLAVALYFLQPFLPDRRLGPVVLFFALASGIYLALLEGTRMAARWFRPLKVVIGLLVVAAGAWIAIPMLVARPGADWKPYSSEALDRAKAEGRPVIIDFFADWCLPCKELERYTFSDPRVVDESGRFLLMKADLTSFESPLVRTLRDRFDVVGVPTIVLIDGQGTDRRELRVHGFEDSTRFLARMRQVR